MHMEEVVAVLISVGMLHVFFRAVESKWPASYFALASGPDYAISRNLVRYLGFRLVPVFVVATFAAVSLARGAEPVVLPVVLIGLLHGLLTSGRALIGLVRSGRARRRPLLVAMHPVVIVFVTAAALAASLGASVFEPFVPEVRSISSDLWTGVVAGIVGAYAVRVAQGQSVETERVLLESRRTIDDKLWLEAGSAAVRHGADAALVRGVMLVENMQRPRWFRRVEGLFARILRQPASLGLLQASAAAGQSETTMLDGAVSERFAGVVVRDADDYVSWEAVEGFARQYNPDPAFVELLVEAVNWADDTSRTV